MKRLMCLCVILFAFLPILAFSGGAGEPAQAAVDQTKPVKSVTYAEPYALSQLVKQGKLPAVEKRLPDKPLVVKPLKSVGKYGGTWRMVVLGIQNGVPHVGAISHLYEPLIRYSDDMKSFVPGIIERWETSSDGKVWTFYLRSGLKWSDGQPCTADDIEFAFSDVLTNKELLPVPVPWLLAGGQLPKFEKVDKYIVRFTFDNPNPFFHVSLAGAAAIWDDYFLIYPKHYLQQFHKKYAKKEDLDAAIKKANFDTWDKLFWDRVNWKVNPDLPVLRPWKIVNSMTGATVANFERNPYYWKVDTAGNQLPYIDKLINTFVGTSDIAVMNAINGEIDFELQPLGIGAKNMPMVLENQKKGGYRVVTGEFLEPNTVPIFFNQTSQDPVLRTIFRDKRFRIAMSLAINRSDIIKLGYTVGDNIMEARQIAPLPNSPVYSEKLAKQYTEFDPVKANSLLDEIGLDKRDADGFRLRPDGKTMELLFDGTLYTQLKGTGWDVAYDIIIANWNKVGVKTTLRSDDWPLYCQRQAANEINVDALCGIGGGGIPVITPGEVDIYTFTGFWKAGTAAPLWIKWLNSDGKEGEEPPPEVKKLSELYNQFTITVDEAKQKEIIRQMLKIHEDNFWMIGICRRPGVFGVVTNHMKNVPDVISINANIGGTGGYTNSSQFYFDDSK